MCKGWAEVISCQSAEEVVEGRVSKRAGCDLYYIPGHF